MTNEEDQNVQQRTKSEYDTVYDRWAASPTIQRIWRGPHGAEYPKEIDPTSFVTIRDLKRMATEMKIGRGNTFSDLACGRGGPGLWVARETGALLIGIDISRTAISHASRKAVDLSLQSRASFRIGDFTNTGLPSSSLDGAMSVDALWIVPDKLSALQEAKRILRQGASFVFTTWDCEVAPAAWPPQIKDHRSLLKDVGFKVTSYEATANWEGIQREIYQKMIKEEDMITSEMGEAAAASLLSEAKLLTGITDGTDYLSHICRILIVAEKSC